MARVFTPGASLDEIGSWLEATLDARERPTAADAVADNQKEEVDGSL